MPDITPSHEQAEAENEGVVQNINQNLAESLSEIMEGFSTVLEELGNSLKSFMSGLGIDLENDDEAEETVAEIEREFREEGSAVDSDENSNLAEDDGTEVVDSDLERDSGAADMNNILNTVPGIDHKIIESEGIQSTAAVIKKEGFDPNLPYKVVVHFPGTGSENPGNTDRLKRTATAFEKDADDQTILVYGKSPYKQPRSGPERYAYSKTWPDDMALYFRESKAVVRSDFGANTSCEEVTVQGHSAGGKALENCAKQGFVAKYKFFDATYGNYAEHTLEALNDNNISVDIMIVSVTDGTARGARAVEGEPGVEVIWDDVSHARTINKYGFTI